MSRVRTGDPERMKSLGDGKATAKRAGSQVMRKKPSPNTLKDRPTGMKNDPDYYKRGNFMDVKAEAKQAADKKAYGPEGKPATVSPKKGRDALTTAIPQSTIAKRRAERKIEDKYKFDPSKRRKY